MRRVLVSAGLLLGGFLCCWVSAASGSSKTSEPLNVSCEARSVQSALQARTSRCMSGQETGGTRGERWHSSYKTCVDAESGICNPITY